MTKKSHIALLQERYAEEVLTYADYSATVAGLLDRLLKADGVRVHSITERVKSSKSMMRKIESSGAKYSDITDITDLAGIRIITYFADEVDLVAEVIRREFEIDDINSVDKRGLLDPDRFGYMSLHFVVRLLEQRRTLLEYSRFKECRAEIQVRSILQHTWAEIEHDLGYKTEFSIPKETRRRFARLAGLLEIADSEFENIRNELRAYEESIVSRIGSEPSKVSLDQASIIAFLQNSKAMKTVYNAVRTAGLSANPDSPDTFVPKVIPALEYVGLHTIEQVEAALQTRAKDLGQFLVAELKSSPKYVVGMAGSLPLLYLAFMIAAESSGKDGIKAVAARTPTSYAEDENLNSVWKAYHGEVRRK